MSSEIQLPYADTFRDVLALITAFIATVDDDDTDTAPDAPVRGLMDDVIQADPEQSIVIFAGLVGALIHQLAEAQGTTDEEAWRDQATAFAAGLAQEEPS